MNKDKNASMYRFHGSPDLTITKIHLYEHCGIILELIQSISDTTATPTSSRSTLYANPDIEVYGTIENSIRNEKDNGVPVVQKTGELLANMHIVLKNFFEVTEGEIDQLSDNAWAVTY